MVGIRRNIGGEGGFLGSNLSIIGEIGIFGVVVKCVDIRRNIGGEGGFLVYN